MHTKERPQQRQQQHCALLAIVTNALQRVVCEAQSLCHHHGKDACTVSVDQARFLAPFCFDCSSSPSSVGGVSSVLPPHLLDAAQRLAGALSTQAVPSLGPVGLLQDDARLLALVEAKGNAWLKQTMGSTGSNNAVGDCGDEDYDDAATAERLAQSILNLVIMGGDSFRSSCSKERSPSTANAEALIDCGDVDATVTLLRASSSHDPLGGPTTPSLPSAAAAATTTPSTLLSPAVANTVLARLVVARLFFGFRVTIGTVTAIGVHGFSLPSEALLVASFRRPHCPPREVISVGARALAKHIHRDGTLSWWGNHHMKGTQVAKNSAAEAVLMRILRPTAASGGTAATSVVPDEPMAAPLRQNDDENNEEEEDIGSGGDNHSPPPRSAWRNFHMLPHGYVAYELRVPEGYGARWQLSMRGGVCDDAPPSSPPSVDCPSSPSPPLPLPDELLLTFRGFLEPHDADGHAKEWRH